VNADPQSSRLTTARHPPATFPDRHPSPRQPTRYPAGALPQHGIRLNLLAVTPKGRLTKLERDLLTLSWQEVRPGVKVKLLPREQELYVFAQSEDRTKKERAMRRAQLKKLVKRLQQLEQMSFKDSRELVLKLGEAKGRYRYLLRTNLCARDPQDLWRFYIQLTEVEAAFKNLKDDLQLRPIHHQLEHRVEAHIFVAFMAYCLRARESARAAQTLGARTDLTRRAGQVRRHPDARRALP